VGGWTDIRQAVMTAAGVRLIAPSKNDYPDIDLAGPETVEIVGLVDRAVRFFI
jgi:hypothetical protein